MATSGDFSDLKIHFRVILNNVAIVYMQTEFTA